MVEYDPADVERRLKAGEWLPTPAVAVLFKRDRTTIYRWAKRGMIGHRMSPGGGELELDPADVLRLLDGYREVRRGGADLPPGPERDAVEEELRRRNQGDQAPEGQPG